MREIAGPSFGISAWALVTGVAMIKSGLTLPLAMFMSVAVYAGSAQLAALPLIAAGAPLWVIWATAVCMNLRFVIFSAHWRKYFGQLPRAQRLLLMYLTADLNYVLFIRRFPEPKPAPEQLPYLLGSIVWSWLSWQIPALIGIALGDRVPTEWELGFAGVLALLGLSYSTLQGRNSWIAGIVAVYSTLFGIGKLIFGQMGSGAILLVIAVIAFSWIARSFRSEPTPPMAMAMQDRIAAD